MSEWTGAGWVNAYNPQYVVTIRSPMDYGAAGDGVNDDSAAVQACADAIDTAGGGAMWIDKRYFIDADVTITNKVLLIGIGPTLSGFVSDSNKRLYVTGVELGWRYTVENVGFEGVNLRFGQNSVDKALGLRVVNCIFNTCAVGCYVGWNTFLMLVDNCQFVDCGTGFYYDAATGGASSGASMRVTNCGFFDSGDLGACDYGIYIDGNNATDPIDFHILACHFEDIGEAGIAAVNCTERHFLYIRNAHFERMASSYAVASAVSAGGFTVGKVWKIVSAGTTSFTSIGAANNSVGTIFTSTGLGTGTGTARRVAAFCISNDGAIVYFDKAWNWTDGVWFEMLGGRMTVTGITGNWQPHYLARMTAGELRIDAATMYTPNEYWGPSYGPSELSQPMLVGDTAGTGKVVALRTPTITRVGGYTAKMTNAAPDSTWKATGTDLWVATPGDGNTRIYDFVLDVSSVGTDNWLRIEITDGATNPYVDVVMPVFVGYATIRLVWIQGASLTAQGIFSATTPGATTSQGLYGTVSDTTLTNNYRWLKFHSLKAGATASEMTVKNLTETILGPYTIAT